jgi:hypothetical protein
MPSDSGKSAEPAVPSGSWEDVAGSQAHLWHGGDSEKQRRALSAMLDGAHVAVLDRVDAMQAQWRRMFLTRMAKKKSFFVRDALGSAIHTPSGQTPVGRHKLIEHGVAIGDNDEDHSLLVEVGLYYRIAGPDDVAQGVGLASGEPRKTGTTSTKDSAADRTSVGSTSTLAVSGQTSDAALDVGMFSTLLPVQHPRAHALARCFAPRTIHERALPSPFPALNSPHLL